MAHPVRIMEMADGEGGQRSSATAVVAEGAPTELALIERTAEEMITTLPRLMKTIKHHTKVPEGESVARELGESQVMTLHTLANTGKQLTSELARRFSVTNPTMTRIVDGLVERGYVMRQPDAEDRRCIFLQLTAEGKDAAQQMRQQFTASLVEFLRPLTPEQLADLGVAMRHLQGLMVKE